MRLYLIRHAHAGSRGSGHHDIYRQLSDRGFARANELVDVMAEAKIERVISSPATRCVQTVEPLAANRGLEVEEHPGLWEDADLDEVFELLAECVQTNGAALSSHGNIIPSIVEQLGRDGASIKGRGCEKGSIWMISHNGKRFTKARYLNRKADGLPS